MDNREQLAFDLSGYDMGGWRDLHPDDKAVYLEYADNILMLYEVQRKVSH